uniref:Photosystem I assembly protein Ycf4 n=2 Tax=Meristotropis TaxID=2699349 RepID=A0A6M4EDE1_9FABA|nr:photosystem I assembly protein Ycf4 [Glycyrrhiza gontscharovii]QJQ78533.1 photosystem I assembly protein Ycf4 [Meristotropis bucharica]QJQ78761.1 photosystem I assembly protein Ycf4 [Meristotropis sp. LD-2020]QJQ78609.1 Ycf4 [Meristotropis bucharica]QJQ78685.1 photosystem I assembly protein Ycf4 [Meristotropis bucharica]USW05156.1 photosystem I assembly protein Ycf4 [Glycyrrhiza gontscharovii]
MTWESEHVWRSEDAWIDIVTGSRKPSDFFWASFILLGSLGVLLISASGYYGRNLLSFISSEFEPELVPFLPQGATMTFYGTAGLFLSFSWWLLIFWNVGSGYDFFDKKNKMVCFFRYGFPGKNRRIFIRVRMDDIQSLIIQSQIETKKDSRYRNGVLYMQTREQGAIPLTPIDDYYRTPRKVAQKAWDLSIFLRVPMEI